MKDNEWFTPAKYIEATRQVMGDIDLDPASCELANQTVKAAKYYSKEDNGLDHQWHGRVWLNPPYGHINHSFLLEAQTLQQIFVNKLVKEYTAGNIEQAMLLLLGNACFNDYFSPLWDHLLCFHKKPLTFERADGSQSRFGFGTIFVYLGPNEQKFTEVFSQFGRIAKAIDTPRQQHINLELWGGVAV